METAYAVTSAFAVIGLGCLGTVNSVLNSAVGSAAAAGVTSTGTEQSLPTVTDDVPGAIPPPPGFTYNGTALVGISAVYCLFAPFMAVVSLVCLVYKKRLTKCCTLRTKMAWWHALGGVCGVIGMLASVLCTPRLGALLFGALSVSGALLSSVVLDHFGFVGMTVRRATLVKAAAASIALVGVAVTAVASTQSVPDPSAAPVHAACGPCVGTDSAPLSAHCCSGHSLHTKAFQSVLHDTAGDTAGLPLHILAACGVASFFAGTLGPIQALLNWRLGHALVHKSMALVVSATMAGLLSLLVLGVYLAIAVASAPESQSQIDVPAAIVSASFLGLRTASTLTPWMWLGAVGAIVTKAGSVMFPKRIGTSTYIILVLTGEMGISLVLDHVGALGLPTRPATVARGIGIAIIWGAALLMRFSDGIEGALAKHLSSRDIVVPLWLVGTPASDELPTLIIAKAETAAVTRSGDDGTASTTPEAIKPGEELDHIESHVCLLERMEKGISSASRGENSSHNHEHVMPAAAAAQPPVFAQTHKSALELARLHSVHAGQSTDESGLACAGDRDRYDGRASTHIHATSMLRGTSGNDRVTRAIRALSSKIPSDTGDATALRTWWPHSKEGSSGCTGAAAGEYVRTPGEGTHVQDRPVSPRTAPVRGVLRASSWFCVPVHAQADEALLSEYSPQSPTVHSPGLGLRLPSRSGSVSALAHRAPGHASQPLHRKMTSLDAMCDALVDDDDEDE